MASRYGLAFANLFHATAKKTPIRKPTVSVTNTKTPQSIEAQGFVYYGVAGGARVYVRADGDEVWLMSKGTPSPSGGDAAKGDAAGPSTEHPASNPSSNASSKPATKEAEKEQVAIEVEELNGGRVYTDEDGNPIIVIPDDDEKEAPSHQGKAAPSSSAPKSPDSSPTKPAPEDDDDDDDDEYDP